MADDVKTTRGTINGVTVQVSEETAGLLGSDLQPENKSTTSKSSSSSSSK